MKWFSLHRNYVSEIDTVLEELEAKPESHSAARQREIDKHQRIAALRDNPERSDDSSTLWSEF